MMHYRQMEESISLRDAKKYVLHSLDTLVFFVQNVELKESFSMSMDYEYCANAFQKAGKNFGCKVIRPFKKLCLRLIDKGMGLSQIHLAFLKVVLRTKLYFEAIQVIEKKAVPTSLSPSQFCEYMYYAGMLYMVMKKYPEANQCLAKIVNGGIRITRESKVFVLALKSNIILNQILGKGNYSKDEIKRIFEEMKISNPLFEEWDINNQQQFEAYSCILQKKQIKSPEQLAILEKDNNLAYYKEIDQKGNEVKRKVAGQIRDKNERIKISQISGKDLSEFKTMKTINSFKHLAKYDPQNKILYLNHNIGSPEIINNLISRCYEMYAIVSAEKEPEERGRGMGGMGGLGSLMSMLGGRF